MEQGSDKRQFKRIQRHFIIRVRIRSESPIKNNPAEWEVVTSQDLSGGGMCFNLGKEIKCGSLLDIIITFPLGSSPIRCIGKVLRVQKPEYSPVYRIAVIFLEIDEKDREIINTFAKSITK